jgi:protein with PEP-CTERM/exosortase system signal
MKTKNIIKWLALPAVLGLLSLATAQADTTLGDNTYAAKYTAPSSSFLLGTVIPGLEGNQGQVARDVLMTNNLLSKALGSQTGSNPGTTSDPLYSRTALAGSGPANGTNAAFASGLGGGSGSTVTVDLNHFGMFTYLVVAYDGPNSGVAIWDIAGLTGNITFAAYAYPQLNGVGPTETGNLLNGGSIAQYRITSWTLLNPTSAPDGGATVMLLGAALGALGMVRRYLAS